MKQNLLLTSLLVAGMPLASCTSEDNVFDNSENTVKEFVLSICNFKEDAEDSSTRTSYSYGSTGYEAVWTEGDILGIYPLGGDQVSFPISDGAGSNTAVFDGWAWVLRGTYKYASYYPFSTVNYTIPETAIQVSYIGQVQKGNNTTADISKAYISENDGGSISFSSYPSFAFGNNSILVECKGDIRTLIDYEIYKTAGTDIACFAYLFKGTPIVSAPELPSTILTPYCYYSMFEDCTQLLSAPKHPATSLVRNCYESMFEGCSKLDAAPELPATVLDKSCYYSMFYNCDNLTQCPTLPATNLANYCYQSMFYDCDKITQASA